MSEGGEGGDTVVRAGGQEREAEGRPERPRRHLRTMFQGTRALVASRHPYRATIVVVAAVAGVLLGGGATFAGSDSQWIALLYCMGCLVVGATATLHAGVNLTMGLGGAGGPSRREELALLPIGRLALPAAVYLGAAATSAAAWAVWSVTFLACAAPGIDHHAPLPALLGIGLLTLVVAGLLLAGPIALANRTSALLFALYAYTPFMALVLRSMGHRSEAAALVGGLGAGALLLLALGLPFVVHALGPAATCTARGVPTREAAQDGLILLLALLVSAAFVSGPSLLLLVAGGALVAWQVRGLRRLPRPARHPWRASPRAHALTLVAFAPMGLAAWGLDLRAQARADAGEGLTVSRRREGDVLLDPTGQRAALLVNAPYVAGFSARRVVVVQLAGPAAGRRLVVPARFPRLEPGAWSADGRWLAVHDDAAGRLEGPALQDGLALPLFDSGVVASGMCGLFSGQTYLVDAEAGEVRAVPRRALAPGWTAPEELVEVALGLGATVRLRRGDETICLPSRSSRLVGYLDGRAVLEEPGTSEKEFDRRFGLLTGVLRRWSGGVLAPLPVAPRAWVVVDDASAAAVEDERMTLARGADPLQRVTLEGLRVNRGSLEEGAALAIAAEGLVRLSLPDLSRTLLVPGARVVQRLAGRAGAFATRTGSDWFLIDGNRAARRLELPPRSAPLALAADGRIVATSPEGLALVEPDGSSRPLVGAR